MTRTTLSIVAAVLASTACTAEMSVEDAELRRRRRDSGRATADSGSPVADSGSATVDADRDGGAGSPVHVDHHIAQSARGAGDGSSCADARPVSFFNSASSWGSRTDQIGPGELVRLCGTITSDLTFQASGTADRYITVDGAGATMAGTFVERGKAWWRVQNVTWIDGYDRQLISITSGSNGIFEGNHADDVTGDPSVWIDQDGVTLPHDIVVRDNFIRTAAADLGDVQIDIVKTSGSYRVVIEGNHLEMRIRGASPYSSSHDDVIQGYEKGGSSAGNPYDWIIRHNRIVMNTPEAHHRSWCMLEAFGGTNEIYGNVFLGIDGASGANGCSVSGNASDSVWNVFGNTFVAKGEASNNTLAFQGPGTLHLRNNIVSTVGQTASYSSMETVRDHNLWDGSNIPSCSGVTGELCGVDPMFTSYAADDFSLASGSPAVGAGVDLGAPYDTAIAPGATWPGPTLVVRPAGGRWDIGAYQR